MAAIGSIVSAAIGAGVTTGIGAAAIGSGITAAGIGAAAAGVGAASSLYSSYKSGKQGDAALKQQGAVAANQLEISQQELDMAREQWNLYRDKIFPIELEAQKLGITAQDLATQRGEIDLKLYQDYYAPLKGEFARDASEGIRAQPERAARDARINVDQSFDSAEGQIQRNLERRGVMPGSGAYDAGVSDNTLNRAAAQGFAVNRAIEGERDRAEDVNFNRKAVALGRQPLAPAPVQSPGSPGVTPGSSASLYNSASSGLASVGSQYGNMANTYGNAAQGGTNAAIQLGQQAYDLYNKYRTPQVSSGGGYAPQSSVQGLANPNLTLDYGFAEGGPVQTPMLSRGGMAPNPGGEVSGPQGRDQVPAYIEGQNGETYPAKLQNDEYVIPADVVKRIGTNELDDIIARARQIGSSNNNQSTLKRASGGR